MSIDAFQNSQENSTDTYIERINKDTYKIVLEGVVDYDASEILAYKLRDLMNTIAAEREESEHQVYQNMVLIVDFRNAKPSPDMVNIPAQMKVGKIFIDSLRQDKFGVKILILHAEGAAGGVTKAVVGIAVQVLRLNAENFTSEQQLNEWLNLYRGGAEEA